MNPAPLDVELCERSLEQATIQSNYIQSGPKFFVQPLSEKLCEDLVSKMGNFKKERRLETIDEHSRNVFWKVQQKEDLSKEIVSNARIVEWEDGTMGLFVGKHYLPLSIKKNSQYCFFTEEEHKVYCRKAFPDSVLIPKMFQE